jgi:hypothetical protein
MSRSSARRKLDKDFLRALRVEAQVTSNLRLGMAQLEVKKRSKETVIQIITLAIGS